jgi:BNR repeat-like domain
MRRSRAKALLSSAAVLSAAAVLLTPAGGERKGKVRGEPLASVVAARGAIGTVAPPLPVVGFAPQSRRGFTAGDQWEPAIAADAHGTVYILYPQYLGVPGCPSCPSPTMILQVSQDRGTTWGAPRLIATPGSGQFDAQVAVDPVDGRTAYAAWLQDNKSDIAVARSDDFGDTWSVVIANSTNAATDKPILAVRGPHVYVGFNHTQKVWVASSHDGGHTFSNATVNANANLGWSLAGGGVVDPAGNVHFAWAGYKKNGQAKGPVNLYVSRSTDGGATWTSRLLDVSASPPDCSAYQCGWAYLGAQLTMAGDEAGVLYGLWNMGTVDGGPERIFFARSTDAGLTWSAKADVSLAPPGAAHAFPAVVAGSAGDVRIAWMDARGGTLWNTYYRSSTNGGASWSAETDLSTYVPGFAYIQPGGFGYPFGDYFEMDIDDQGDTHAVWGEGLNYQTPGSIWYTRGR